MSIHDMEALVGWLGARAEAMRAHQKALALKVRKAERGSDAENALVASHAEALQQARIAERDHRVADEALQALRYDPSHRTTIRDLRRQLEEEHDLRLMLQARMEAAESRLRFREAVR